VQQILREGQGPTAQNHPAVDSGDAAAAPAHYRRVRPRPVLGVHSWPALCNAVGPGDQVIGGEYGLYSAIRGLSS
jgi:hypothetical protein